MVYLLQTSSGCDILVREKGHAPNVFMLFETGCDDYDWMNGVVAYGKAAQVAGGISVDVWKVSGNTYPEMLGLSSVAHVETRLTTMCVGRVVRGRLGDKFSVAGDLGWTGSWESTSLASAKQRLHLKRAIQGLRGGHLKYRKKLMLFSRAKPIGLDSPIQSMPVTAHLFPVLYLSKELSSS